MQIREMMTKIGLLLLIGALHLIQCQETETVDVPKIDAEVIDTLIINSTYLPGDVEVVEIIKNETIIVYPEIESPKVGYPGFGQSMVFFGPLAIVPWLALELSQGFSGPDLSESIAPFVFGIWFTIIFYMAVLFAVYLKVRPAIETINFKYPSGPEAVKVRDFGPFKSNSTKSARSPALSLKENSPRDGQVSPQ